MTEPNIIGNNMYAIKRRTNASALQKAGRKVISQKGSHVKVGKESLREIIPMHRELKKGLEQALLKRLETEGGQK